MRMCSSYLIRCSPIVMDRNTGKLEAVTLMPQTTGGCPQVGGFFE